MKMLSIYKGEKSFEMSNKKKHPRTDKKYKFLNFILEKVLFPLLPTLVLAILSLWLGLINLPRQVENIQLDINNLNSHTAELDKNIEYINGKLNINKEFSLGDDDSEYKIADSNTVMSDIRYTGDFSVDQITGQITLKELSSENDIVAKTIDGKKTFNAKEIINKQVIVPYEENGYCIIFYGKYNMKFHWDGICTTNVYKDNKLYLITNARYNDGNITTYKQIIQDKDEKAWSIIERKHESEYDSGYTFKYSRNIDYERNFDYKKISKENILTFSNFRRKIESSNKMLSYYNGQTSNGKYNDSTGDAFWIKFDSNGKLQIFYNGNFKDGKLCDHKYERNDPNDYAWQIVHDNVGYFYYKGDFVNNRRDGNLSKSPYITLQEAKDLVSKFDYDFSSLWYKSKNTK